MKKQAKWAQVKNNEFLYILNLAMRKNASFFWSNERFLEPKSLKFFYKLPRSTRGRRFCGEYDSHKLANSWGSIFNLELLDI